MSQSSILCDVFFVIAYILAHKKYYVKTQKLYKNRYQLDWDFVDTTATGICLTRNSEKTGIYRGFFWSNGLDCQ